MSPTDGAMLLVSGFEPNFAGYMHQPNRIDLQQGATVHRVSLASG